MIFRVQHRFSMGAHRLHHRHTGERRYPLVEDLQALVEGSLHAHMDTGVRRDDSSYLVPCFAASE